MPAIVSLEQWEQAQEMLDRRKRDHVRAGPGQNIHRYSGLIRCGDCGRVFTGKRIKLKHGERVEYVCSTYQRYGKEHCASHAIREETLDLLIQQELLATKRFYQKNWDALERSMDNWVPKEVNARAQIQKQKDQIELLEEEVETILMERIRDKANAERYDRMIRKREEQIEQAKKRIAELENIGQVIRSRQAKLRKDIGLLDEILAEGTMSEAHLRMLVEKIIVYEKEGSLSLEIKVKAPFQNHTDAYEDGGLTNRELEALITAG